MFCSYTQAGILQWENKLKYKAFSNVTHNYLKSQGHPELDIFASFTLNTYFFFFNTKQNHKTVQYYLNTFTMDLQLTYYICLNRVVYTLLRSQAPRARIMPISLFIHYLEGCKLHKNSSVRDSLYSEENNHVIILYVKYVTRIYVINIYIYIFVYRKVIVFLHHNATCLKNCIQIILQYPFFLHSTNFYL